MRQTIDLKKMRIPVECIQEYEVKGKILFKVGNTYTLEIDGDCKAKVLRGTGSNDYTCFYQGSLEEHFKIKILSLKGIAQRAEGMTDFLHRNGTDMSYIRNMIVAGAEMVVREALSPNRFDEWLKEGDKWWNSRNKKSDDDDEGGFQEAM